MKLSKNVNNKKCAPQMIFFNEKKNRKIRIIFDIKNWLNVRILQFLTTFTQLIARLKNFLRGWILFLGLYEGLVECATVCVKSEVIPMVKGWASFLANFSNNFEQGTFPSGQLLIKAPKNSVKTLEVRNLSTSLAA